MTSENFRNFVEKICQNLESISKANPEVIAACNTGTAFEQCVVNVIYNILDDFDSNANIDYTPGSHAFPDVVIKFPDGTDYGIEIKSSVSKSSKNWKTLGNSILGRTRIPVKDTYIIFGKTALGNQAFRFKRYEDAITDIAVTHSPRYQIDMDLEPKETFFKKSGIAYQTISTADKPIELITDYFKSLGHHAWWLAESTPAAIRMLSDLPTEEKKEFIGYCFVHFPEVFSNTGDRYKRCATWLASEHSIVSSSLRDNFSAGGKIKYEDFGYIPKIFDTLIKCKPYVLKALDDATIEELHRNWGESYRPEYEELNKLYEWLRIASNHCQPAIETGYDSLKLLIRIME